jgi:hypothetical protein
LNSIDIHYRAGLTAQVSIIKPAKTENYNTKAVQRHENKTLNIKNNKKYARRKLYKLYKNPKP